MGLCLLHCGVGRGRGEVQVTPEPPRPQHPLIQCKSTNLRSLASVQGTSDLALPDFLYVHLARLTGRNFLCQEKLHQEEHGEYCDSPSFIDRNVQLFIGQLDLDDVQPRKASPTKHPHPVRRTNESRPDARKSSPPKLGTQPFSLPLFFSRLILVTSDTLMSHQSHFCGSQYAQG